MQFYALIYHVTDDYMTRRVQYREEHLQLAQAAHDRGELILGGAFAEPPDKALLIFRASDRSAVEAFVNKDPYVINGLVSKWEIRPWTVVIGKEILE